MKKNERAQALAILAKVIWDRVPLTQAMDGKETSSLCKELCFGVCRHYVRLQIIADDLMDKRPKDEMVWLVILLGLYQLHFLHKPHFAVVKETVALLDPLHKSWAKGFVNAILRTFCREQESRMEKFSANEEVMFGHPRWFVQRLQQDWPQHWQKILQANDEHPPLSLRVNSQKIARNAYLKRLEEEGIEAVPHRYSSDGLMLLKPCDVTQLPGFAAGECSVQDESAQLAVTLLDLKPGLRVLDACCAPGGKTCHILEKESQLKELLALDVSERRLQRTAENLARLQLQAKLLLADAQQPTTWWDGHRFDRILLDAPCSATGVIRRHPDIKLLRTEAEVFQAAEVQKALLENLWPLLAPNGLLVYATCSVLKEENEHQITSFAENHRDCLVLKMEKDWGIFTGHGWQMLPDSAGGDGFFYSVMQKRES